MMPRVAPQIATIQIVAPRLIKQDYPRIGRGLRVQVPNRRIDLQPAAQVGVAVLHRERQRRQIDASHQPECEPCLQEEEGCVAFARPDRRTMHRREPRTCQHGQHQQQVAYLLHKVEPAHQVQQHKAHQGARARSPASRQP
ncbi:MAG: hypothetical protein CFK49_09090 [Armatimonadetes bacterium JP3_11]|nr:MAG: hypothetical protein CFK49_09090 [Armatimonadetes bacterium JP3_11]